MHIILRYFIAYHILRTLVIFEQCWSQLIIHLRSIGIEGTHFPPYLCKLPWMRCVIKAWICIDLSGHYSACATVSHHLRSGQVFVTDHLPPYNEPRTSMACFRLHKVIWVS